MGAIALDGLEIMQRHTATMTMPATRADGTSDPVSVRVPQLGAYVLNKAATFQRRRPFGGRGNPKRAKDLLYLRDVMDGGADVVGVIAEDVGRIRAGDSRAQLVVDQAANTLDGILSPVGTTLLDEAGAMLAERDPALGLDGAVASVTGHLADLRDLLAAFRSPPSIGGDADGA